ncbi:MULTISPECIES: FadR/GntR family transcriptional regulator [unclassified Cytobacillus]|uniref:FadR/GntR family transcriptional regulator n=1 Tax=unclassified Cytobacillus TaxID=2675268 RepID=UPI00203AD640|nr:GntR family transcriptional regulator [Cytobacillus sp. AMY 15.2]MCM3093263.1 GntR family transcriptional regulator [Cytobacillus sp. AMY 15.2]
MENNYQIRSVPRMFEEVTRSIINYIHDEELTPGAKLPPERTLSELLGVSRSSIREGIRILELLNYLESRQGGGTFVSIPTPFIIPYRLIKQSVDYGKLKKYFEIALLNAEKIIFLTMNDSSSTQLNTSNKSFWMEFSDWINLLGKQLENEYYLSLWNTAFSVVYENNFLDSLNVSSDINELKIAYYKRDKQLISDFFMTLIK